MPKDQREGQATILEANELEKLCNSFPMGQHRIISYVLTAEDPGDATFNLFLDTGGSKKLSFNRIITGTSFSSTVGDISTVSVSFVTTGAITASI